MIHQLYSRADSACNHCRESFQPCETARRSRHGAARRRDASWRGGSDDPERRGLTPVASNLSCLVRSIFRRCEKHPNETHQWFRRRAPDAARGSPSWSPIGPNRSSQTFTHADYMHIMSTSLKVHKTYTRSCYNKTEPVLMVPSAPQESHKVSKGPRTELNSRRGLTVPERISTVPRNRVLTRAVGREGTLRFAACRGGEAHPAHERLWCLAHY